jgi:virulence-associated protein VapD
MYICPGDLVIKRFKDTEINPTRGTVVDVDRSTNHVRIKWYSDGKVYTQRHTIAEMAISCNSRRYDEYWEHYPTRRSDD